MDKTESEEFTTPYLRYGIGAECCPWWAILTLFIFFDFTGAKLTKKALFAYFSIKNVM
jgi:hypothetical protein